MIELGRVDDSALGDRWIYTFDDPRVNSFEPAFRRFHRRYEADSRAMAVLAAREAFMERVLEDKTRTPMPRWLFECLSQAMRRVDQSDRDCYFYVFQRLFDFLEDSETLPEGAEEQIWQELEHLLDGLAADAVLLSALADSVQQITEEDGTAVARPGTAWHADGEGGDREVTVWLAEHAEGIDGFRVGLGFEGHDRYDHSCEVVTFPAGGDRDGIATRLTPRADEILAKVSAVPAAADGGAV